jgi:serine/threonine protein kinase
MATTYDDSRDPLIGTTIGGRFVIRRLIGDGGMGSVYEGFQSGLETPVAIKILHARYSDKPAALKRFQSEARIASAIKHPNVVPTHAFGVLDNSAPYLVMEYVDGTNLSDYLKQEKTLDKRTFINIFTQCCDGLRAAHELGVVHRDIKPSNIMLVKQPDGAIQAKVADFGIAKQEDMLEGSQGLTRTGEVLGTPMYMSPEQCESKPIDQRSDIYSLGCVMYESLVGSPPFVSDTPFEVMLQHVNAEPASPTEQHPELRKLRTIVDAVMHTLQKSPESRPQTMEQLRGELADADKGISNFKRKRILRVPKWASKAVVAAIAVVFLAVMVVFANQPKHESHFVNSNDPDAVFADAQRLELAGDGDRAAGQYSRFLTMAFGSNPDQNRQWHVQPGFGGEENLRRILRAAKGRDLRLNGEWPDKDPWYQAKNAAQEYYAQTKTMPPWVVQAFDDKVGWTRDHARLVTNPRIMIRQLEFADGLEQTFEQYKEPRR